LADAKAALEAALDKKALEPVLLDVGELCSYAEYMLLISGRSDRQVDAIANAVTGVMKERGSRPLGVEGIGSGQWALLDFGDVVVHVFHHPKRGHYDLESLWIDATRVEIDVPDEARVSPDQYY
jgi:ribosome-associated protein